MIDPDSNYVFIEPRPDPAQAKMGVQCGECGIKFEFGQSYGYCCPHNNCPMQSASGGVS